MIPRAIAHELVRAAGAAEYRRFFTGASDPSRVQFALLRETLKRGEASRFGRERGLGTISTDAGGDDGALARAFAKAIPVGGYESYRPYVESIAAGNGSVLSDEEVLLLEPTSGSTGASKLIPFTSGLRAQFDRAVSVWMHDLYATRKGLRRGRHFWSVTPCAATEVGTEGPPTGDVGGENRVRVGFEDDAEYLGFAGRVLRSVFALPPWVKRLGEMENYYAVATAFLLAAGDLSLVSVWNPSALILILGEMPRHLDRALCALRAGVLELPLPDPAFRRAEGGRGAPRCAPFLRASAVAFPRDRTRAGAVERAFASHPPDSASLLRELWPALDLVSAWADAESSSAFESLGSRFPSARIQPKGLLATEGIVSFPLDAAGGCVPAYRSHHFEFFPAEDGDPAGAAVPGFPIEELSIGRRYFVVMTTAGGLYRYSLGDIVEVGSRWQELPTLRFVARNRTVDLVGEKMHEAFARDANGRALALSGLSAAFALLAPDRASTPPRYVVFIRPVAPAQRAALASYAAALERELLANYHYRYSRDLGQLGQVRVFEVIGDAAAAYIRRLAAEGMRMGNAKTAFLDPRDGWDGHFAGSYIDAATDSR